MLRSPGGVPDKINAIYPGRPGLQPGLVEVPHEAQLGRTLSIARGGGPMPLIDAGGRSQQAHVATIHAQVILPPDAFPVGPANRRAPVTGLLQWGQGGASFTAKLDLRTGICATVVASTVQLSAVFEADATVPDPRAQSALVAAAVVWGTRSSGARVTRTLTPVSIVDGAAATFEVPAFAYAALLYSTVPGFYAAASTSTITLHGGPLVTDDPELVIPAGLVGPQALVNEGLQLSGNTRFVTVTNHEGAPLPLQATFLLAL